MKIVFNLINPLEEYWVPTRDLYTMLRNLLFNFFSWTFCISTAKLGTLCCCLVAQLCLTLLSRVQLCNPMDCRGNLPGYLCPWDPPGIEYWSGLPYPPPKDLPDLGIEPVSPSSPVLQADSLLLGLPWWLRCKSSAYNVGDPGSIPGSGRSSGEGNGTPLQYSCLENPVDKGAW